MTDFKPEVSASELPRGFRPVRLILNNNNQPNFSEVIYDEPCSNFESNPPQQPPTIPPPLPSSQPPISSNLSNLNNGNTGQVPTAQPFWSLPSQEQEQLQQHLQEHLSRSPTPTKFGLQPNLVNADNIEKVITDKEPPSNAEFLYETDAYKFYTVPKSGEKRVLTKIRQDVQTFEPVDSLRTGATHRHGSDWYKTMFKNMHKTDQPKWAYEEPVRVRKNKKANRDKIEESVRNEYIYDNHPPINQYQTYQETERRKKELEKEMQKEWAYTCDEPDPKYVIKKKKASKSKSPSVSRKQYAMIQKGDDIPLNGLGKPAPKSKNKVGFYDQREQAHLISRSPSPRPDSRSPTPCYLTYPANDYVPERPPTPQYIYTQQQFTHELNVQNSQNTNLQPQPQRQIYNQQQQQKIITNKSTRKKTSEFSTIDEWQRKMNDDFNQIYSTLEKNYEIKRLREAGKLVSPLPPSESRKESGSRTARELYLDQQSPSPKPPSRKYYVDPTTSKPLSASDLFDETAYKTTTTTKYNTINTRNYSDLSSNKLNRYNSSQDLNYLNPNNNRTFIDFNNNSIGNSNLNNESSYKQSIYQRNSLDNLNHISHYEQPPVYDFNYKIYAQPTTTRTYTESTYIDNSNISQPRIDLKTKTTSTLKRQNSILDIERKLNEELGDLFANLRSTSSCENRNDYSFKKQTTNIPVVNTIKIDNLASNSNFNSMNLNRNNDLNSNLNTNLNSSFNTNQTRPKSPPIPPVRQTNSNEIKAEQERNQPVVEEEIRPVEVKPVPFDLKPNQDVNNISFQPEEDLDLDELIKKIELDAILQDEMEN